MTSHLCSDISFYRHQILLHVILWRTVFVYPSVSSVIKV